MKRLEYADIAKALAIFAVVLAHVNLVATPGREWMFVNVCYAFHMPFFFMLGGLFLKPGATTGCDGWKGFPAKNFLTLMVPYFVWGVIYMPFSYTNLARLLKAVRPVADEKGGAYAEFAAALERARADGVITADESDELVAMLRKLKRI